MNDRELLELAAKAAGVNLVCKQLLDFSGAEVDAYFNLFEDGRYGCWNPLQDDGDALRLAVKLNMFVDICDECVGTSVSPAIWEKIEILDNDYRPENTKASITRRAIVRAAAEIGKAMP